MRRYPFSICQGLGTPRPNVSILRLLCLWVSCLGAWPATGQNKPSWVSMGAAGRLGPGYGGQAYAANVFANRPIRMELYTGLPGRWTLQEAAEYTYNAAGRFTTRVIVNITDPAMSDTVVYSYLPNGWLSYKKTVAAGGLEADSARISYEVDSAGRPIQIERQYYVNPLRSTTRFAYTPTGFIDTLYASTWYSGQVVRQQIVYRYDAAGKVTALSQWEEDRANPGTYVLANEADSLRYAFGYERPAPLDAVERAYDQNTEPEPYLIVARGRTRHDSLPGLVDFRRQGGQTGNRAFTQVEVAYNNRWVTTGYGSMSYDAQGQLLADSGATLNLSGSVFFAYASQFTNRYDAQNRLVERIQNGGPMGYRRQLYFYAPTAVAGPRPAQLVLAPNPAGHTLQLPARAAGKAFALYNGAGACILTGTLPADATLSLAGLAPGVYHIRAGGQSGRFIKT